ncbi:MAG: YceD family protein [Syntrophales bacterium]
MKININTMPEEGMSLDFDRNGEWFRQFLADEEAGGFLLHRLDFSCMVRKVGDNIYVEGGIRVKAEAPCGRCLEMTELSLQAPFNYTFSPALPAAEEDAELNAADLDFQYYEGDVIDLEEIVFEQVMLQIPMKPLCAESCRGLCPHCGVNLNRATCNCRSEVIDERLAVLKQIKLEH